MTGTSVRGVRVDVRIDTSSKSATAKIGEATNGVNARDEPKMNLTTASSGAKANGRIEGRRRALPIWKESGSEVARRCRSYNLAQKVTGLPKNSFRNPTH